MFPWQAAESLLFRHQDNQLPPRALSHHPQDFFFSLVASPVETSIQLKSIFKRKNFLLLRNISVFRDPRNGHILLIILHSPLLDSEKASFLGSHPRVMGSHC